MLLHTACALLLLPLVLTDGLQAPKQMAVHASRLRSSGLDCPSTYQTAVNQIQRLFVPDDPSDQESMSRVERIGRIAVGWILLIVSKAILLSGSVYLKMLIEKSAMHSTRDRSMQQGALSSTFGLFVGVGMSRIVSGLVGLVCDLILSPATNTAADILPREAFSAALAGASRRCDDGLPRGEHTPELSAVAQGQDEGKSGAARRVLDRGVKASGQFLYRSVFNLFPKFVDSTCILVLLAVKTGLSVGIAAAVVAYLFAISTGMIMQFRIPLLRRQLREQSIANGYAEDALNLAETVAAFGATREEEARYARALKGVGRAGIAVRRSFAVLKFIQATILGVGSTVVALTAWHSNPHLSGPALSSQLAFVQALFAQLCVPLDTFGIHFRDAVSAAEDLRELEELKFRMAPFKEVPGMSAGSRGLTPHMQRQGGGKHAWKDAPHRVSVKRLYYAYPNSDYNVSYVLRNITMEIPSGGYCVGIVGPSGSGKSTLFRVLLGLEPLQSSSHNSGMIRLDGTDMTCNDRTPCFSLVGQENDLFRGLTLANNIRYGTAASGTSAVGESYAQREHDALIVAARDAQLHQLISKLSGGWDAQVGPRGRLLSGGERQRVCLARALYREEMCGGILLLDECTAALDPKTEDLVIRALRSRVDKGATAILVAHRLSSVQRCDRIFVLKDGEIQQAGTHSELMRAGGWYAESWKVQQQNKETG